VAGRRGQHRLQAQAGFALALGPLRRGAAGVGHAGGERVAVALELGHREQARARAAGHRRGRGQLRVQAGDLRPQGAADRREVGGGNPLGDEHRQPPIGARGFAPQNSWVPSIPIRCTSTMLSTIDFAVARPTPTGPPLAV
jgi:hypothetical protein